jgi:hypothetical protein
MSDVQVRPFRRNDREQLTRLVNAHAEAVVPGMSVSVNTVLGSLERRPEEPIADPWVSERVTLVAEQRGLRPVGRHPPARGRGTAGARRVRGARAVAAHRRALPAGRVHPHRAHRGRLPGPGPGPAQAGQAAAGRAGRAPFGRDQRLPPVRRARRGRDRLHRDGDPGPGRAAVPARRLGRRREPARRPRDRRRGVGSWLLGQAAGWLRLAQVSPTPEHSNGSWPPGPAWPPSPPRTT